MSVILNSEQEAAAKHLEGPVLVTAGAGSGKTRVLTNRITNLIESGVKPYNILAITFTNKAADEMRERIIERIEEVLPDGIPAERSPQPHSILIQDSIRGSVLWIMTFHAMCARILRRHIEILGYKSTFTIYDDTDKERVLKRIINDLKLEPDEYLKAVKEHISDLKNDALELDDFIAGRKYLPNIKNCTAIIERYGVELKSNNALDFDDLLVLMHKLLLSDKNILEHYQNKFRYISVDEFQDTNKIQYNIIKLLAKNHKNIFVVGDEDQSIYGWRGANIENIYDFIKEFNPTVYKLEQNYRSTKKILAAANNIIKRNSSHLPKTLWTENEAGVKVEKYTGYDEGREADYVLEIINGLVRHSGYKYSDMAVLMRLNALTRPFEERLMFYNIPYEIYGGFKFYDRKEIKDLVSYLRIMVNPADEEAILRVVNFPKRGIGDGAVAQLRNYVSVTSSNLYDTIINIQQTDLPKSLIAKIAIFSDILSDIERNTPDIRGITLAQFVKYVIERTGMAKAYEEDTEENLSRLANLDQFLDSVSEFEEGFEGAGLADFLETITLKSDVDTLGDNDSLVLATVHSAKGLEFKAVFVVGLDEGVFPISRTESPSDLEEERRLMYVAVTRARERLYLTRASSRFLYGMRKATYASRFFDEVEDEAPAKRKAEFAGNREDLLQKLNIIKAADFTPKSIIDKRLYVPGTVVRHAKFGLGQIVSVSGSGDNTLIGVDFELMGKKTLSLSYAPLEVLE